ncbi:MAG: esterase-like activity of phytase family protein, partial [Methyloceanibacter sp.]
MRLFFRTFSGYAAAVAVAATMSMVIAPALADKPLTVLEGPTPTTVTAIPIDFDRENPSRKEFGKLTFRAGLNLYAKSSHFGGFSAIALDPSGRSLLAVSDAGAWLRASLDYDGRNLKGLSEVVLGPILGADGRPLPDDRERDSEGMTLIDGDTRQGAAYVSFERKHRIARYPFTAERFGPPTGTIPLPAGAKAMSANRGIEAMAVIRAGKLKGTLVAFAEGLADRGGNLQGWLIGGPTPGGIMLKRLGGFDLTDAAPLPDGGIVVLERRFRFSEGIKMRIRRIAAGELKRGALIAGEVLPVHPDTSFGW